MIENFEEKKKYKLILDEINGEEKSITGIQKSLEQKGINMHRLVLTGYLNAMVELGILKEKEIKPARIFSFVEQSRKDIYYVIGENMKKYDEENSGYNSLLLLYHLFERPIFTKEIEKCNVDLPKKDYKSVNSQYRNEYIKKLSELDIKIPQSSLLLEPIEKDNNLLSKLISTIIYNEYDLKRYSIANNNQKTLD
jgi:DNA-binding HxlR family transcriptional regulator